jgi:chemotaxis protein MotA
MASSLKTEKTNAHLDIAALIGVALAVTGILAGLILEGGQLSDVVQLTGALIVFGGTAGAVMLTTPFPIIRSSFRRLRSVLFEHRNSTMETIEEILVYAGKARKNGMVSLEHDAANIADPFLHKAIMLAVDGTELQAIRSMMELEMRVEFGDADTDAKVFDAAGGYAPTIGIIGAVIGLIQVMKHLDDIQKVGHGIAVAFVATIYGVASANLLFLPVAQKIRIRALQSIRSKELMLEGVIGIIEGMNPRLIRRKLEAFSREMAPAGQEVVSGAASGSRAA